MEQALKIDLKVDIKVIDMKVDILRSSHTKDVLFMRPINNFLQRKLITERRFLYSGK
jgi:hypothetical protein